MSLGPAEIGLVLLAVMLLFGYEKLPDASRSLGRSLRIFQGEVDGPRNDTGALTRASNEDTDQTTPSVAVPQLTRQSSTDSTSP